MAYHDRLPISTPTTLVPVSNSLEGATTGKRALSASMLDDLPRPS